MLNMYTGTLFRALHMKTTERERESEREREREFMCLSVGKITKPEVQSPGGDGSSFCMEYFWFLVLSPALISSHNCFYLS